MRGEERDHIGNFLGLGNMPQRYGFAEFFDPASRIDTTTDKATVQHWRIHLVGTYRVDANAIGDVVTTQAAGESGQRGLAGAVGDMIRAGV